MAKLSQSTEEKRANVLLLGIYKPGNLFDDPERYYEEFRSLVKTRGVVYEHELYLKLRSIDRGHFLTKGKLEEVHAYCDENEIEHIICSEILTPMQERNLENVLDVKIFDREQLILEIFQQSAHTAEGKIQVEMAHIEYLKTRLAGKGREFAQQEGRIGSKGPGETAKEMLKRFFADRLRQAKKRLATLRKSRENQRKRRLASKVPLVCLVGYTNAGKSSLLNVLTQSEILAEEKLFATLDTTTRELYFDGKNKVLISDTVGFISELPAHLVEAFQATLEELKYAHLLLHTVDVSNPSYKDHIDVVNQTLEKLGVKAPMLYVFNKIDTIAKKDREKLEEQVQQFTPHVFTHAMSKTGVVTLLSYLRDHMFGKGDK